MVKKFRKKALEREVKLIRVIGLENYSRLYPDTAVARVYHLANYDLLSLLPKKITVRITAPVFSFNKTRAAGPLKAAKNMVNLLQAGNKERQSRGSKSRKLQKKYSSSKTVSYKLRKLRNDIKIGIRLFKIRTLGGFTAKKTASAKSTAFSKKQVIKPGRKPSVRKGFLNLFTGPLGKKVVLKVKVKGKIPVSKPAPSFAFAKSFRRIGKTVNSSPFRILAVFTVTASLLTVSTVYFLVVKDLPNPKDLDKVAPPQTTIIRDRNGIVLYRVYKDANRTWLDWNEIPEVVKKSTLAIEDDRFYFHSGVSMKALARAFLHNTKQTNSRLFQGGSTITQQLVKNRFLSAERTYTRKIKEAILALWTEKVFSKNQIFTFYLNEVGYGGPAYGIEAASQMFFGKTAKELTLSEAAFLAGLPAAPTTFSPFGANPELADNRHRQVLERMLSLKMITQKEHDEALRQKLVFAPQKIDILAPHFVMHVREDLVNRLGEAKVTQGGLDVTTTLDYEIQKKAEEVVKNQIGEIGGRYNIKNASAVVTDPKNGELLAMVGNVDYFDVNNKGHVNITTSLRQPGSSIKVVNYAYAFDHGWTPTSTIDDSAVVYKTPGSKEVYIPKNYDGAYHGRVTLRAALANSYNIPAVKLLNSYGVEKMFDLGKNMGIRAWNDEQPTGLSLTLGGLETTMLDMTRVYQTIANYGKSVDIKIVRDIRDSKGEDIMAEYLDSKKENGVVSRVEAADDGKNVISPLSAYWLIDILSDNNARMAAFGPNAKLSVPNHKIAVKTGTSNNFRDNWTIGFSPDYLVATWVGNYDGSFMNRNLTSGITGAAPIWHEIMTGLLDGKEPKNFEKPGGLVEVKVCATNGLLTCANCPLEKVEFFTPDRVPKEKCNFRPKSECDAVKKKAEEENKSDAEKKALLYNCP